MDDDFLYVVVDEHPADPLHSFRDRAEALAYAALNADGRVVWRMPMRGGMGEVIVA
jgi:hypothetical protein